MFFFTAKKMVPCRKKSSQSFSAQDETGRIHRLPTEIHQFVEGNWEGNWHMAAQFFVVSIHVWTPKCWFFFAMSNMTQVSGFLRLDLSVLVVPYLILTNDGCYNALGPQKSMNRKISMQVLKGLNFPTSSWAMFFWLKPWEGMPSPRPNKPPPQTKRIWSFHEGDMNSPLFRDDAFWRPHFLFFFEGGMVFWWDEWWRISTKSQRSKMEPVKWRQ